MRRSWSSAMVTMSISSTRSAGSEVGGRTSRRSAASSFGTRRASRRRRSRARLRATATSHAAGLSGQAVAGPALEGDDEGLVEARPRRRRSRGAGGSAVRAPGPRARGTGARWPHRWRPLRPTPCPSRGSAAPRSSRSPRRGSAPPARWRGPGPCSRPGSSRRGPPWSRRRGRRSSPSCRHEPGRSVAVSRPCSGSPPRSSPESAISFVKAR